MRDSASDEARPAATHAGELAATGALEIAFERAIVRRGLISSVVVGSLLIAINHGDAILAGNVTTGRAWRMALTVVVPYVVSVVSSVAAIRPSRMRAAPRHARSP